MWASEAGRLWLGSQARHALRVREWEWEWEQPSAIIHLRAKRHLIWAVWGPFWGHLGIETNDDNRRRQTTKTNGAALQQLAPGNFALVSRSCRHLVT